MATPFISAQDLSDYLARDVNADPRTVIALDAACEIVRGYIRQYINLVSGDMVRVDGTGTYSLVLPELPVVEVTEVAVYDTNGENEEILVVNDDYTLGNAGILWRLGKCWRPGKRNVWVTYSHGWDLVEETYGSGYTDPTPTVPTDIRMVALQVATRAFNSGATGGAGAMRSETIGKYSYTTAGDSNTSPTGLLTGEARILDRYRTRRVA
jgi:hypothetical protein